MNKKLSLFSRVVSVACAIGLMLVLLVPIWQIELAAPQYPEGLVLKIHSNKLGGDVDVINGLNHYIGMRTLHTKDFVEFVVLPYIIGTLAFFGLLTAIINRRWFLVTWIGFIVLFGIVSMMDFYRWNYNYGHNLDPTAPIQVPGQSYQPPLIGYKQLLNFGAYSIPDIGGWIFIAVGVLLALALYLELRAMRKKTITQSKSKSMVAVLVMVIILVGCSTKPQPIVAGKDNCEFCKMTIADTRFAAELLTSKGKVFKFDDLHCIQAYLKSDQLKDKEGNSIYLVDFSNGEFIEKDKSLLLKSEGLRSPMGSNTAAFSNNDSIEYYLTKTGGTRIEWNNLEQQ